MESRKAPWPDFAGNPIHEGDVIEHPNGDCGTVVYLFGQIAPFDSWRVEYESGVSRLFPQIGERGQAVVISTKEKQMNELVKARYIGVKEINAIPMSREEYNELRGWTVPADENPDDAGFLVEYIDGGKPNVPGFAGYVSWSPKDVFERAYRPASGMTFGLAIEALKAGHRVARAGWNGKGMWLCLVPGTPSAQLREGTPYRNHLQQEECEILPHIDMWTINAFGRRAMLPGWLASQSDMLAEDWMTV